MMASNGLQAAVEGVEIVAAAAWLGCVAVKGWKVSHDKKKHKEEIDGVVKAFNKTIDSSDLPKLFDKEFNASILTVEVLDSIIYTTPMYENKYLDQYVRQVMDALAFAYNYHGERLRRGDKLDDITSSVLCWVILQLGEKCINVIEYDKVIDYLQRIAQFLNEFASIKGRHSFRFIHLTRVVSKLERAASLLRDHSLSLNLKERVKKVLVVTSTASSELIKACTKLIVPNGHWKYIQAFVPESLAQGILQHAFTYKNWAIEHFVPLITFPHSKLADFLKISAQDYMRALDLETKDINNFIDPKKFQIKEINIHELKAAFHGCENFLTMKAQLGDGTRAVNKLVPVDAEDVEARAAIFIQLMQMILYMNAFRFVYRRLRDSLDILGYSYFDPEDTHAKEEIIFLFTVIDAFRVSALECAAQILVALSSIKAQQINTMMVAGIGNDLYKEIETVIKYIQAQAGPAVAESVSIHNDRLSNTHANQHVPEEKTVVVSGKNPMLPVCSVITTNYELDIRQPVVQNAAAIVPLELTIEQTLFTKLEQIHTRTKELEAKEHDRRVSQYTEVYLKLIILFNHSLQMGAENHSQRINKSQQMQRLLLSQCVYFQEFLQKPSLLRQTETHTLVSTIQAGAADKDNKFLDEHNPNSHWLIRFFKSKLMNTRSRNEVSELVESCKKLQIVR